MNAQIDISTITLKTDRLLLRPWRETDLQDFYNYASVDGVGQMAGWTPHKDLEESQCILEHFIEDKKTFALEYQGKVIGSLGIEQYNAKYYPELANISGRELGYVLSKDYWGQGLMPEAVKAVIRYLFDVVKLDFILVGHFDWNKQSARVIEKCGFRYIKSRPYETRYGTVENSEESILYRSHYMDGFFFENDTEPDTSMVQNNTCQANDYKEQDAQFYIKLAETKLEICEKYEQEEPDVYRRLIIGYSTFSIRRPTSDGKFEQCSWAIMEALYNKKRKFPNSNIDQILYQVLLTEFKNEISPMFLKHCIDCLLYQMNSEKQRTSPFNLDIQTLLEELKNNIQRNYDRYKNFEIIEDLENYDQRIEKNCGRHIL